MKFGPVVKEEMLFKDISYLELWQPFCSAEQNCLYNFGRRHHEEQSCEIILTLKVFLIWSSGSPFVQQSITVCAILVEGVIRNNSVKWF